MELIKQLREEAERLSAHSIDRGVQEAGLAANLASQAADALEQMEAVMTRLSDMSIDVAVHLAGDERRAFGRVVNDADAIIGRTRLPPAEPGDGRGDAAGHALKTLLNLTKFEFKGRVVPEPWARAIAKAEAALAAA